ncbi:MAG: class IV adenylate cyclase, partial [Acidobacteriota bacterium]
ALGVIGRVRKRRRLYLAGNTRIHLDEVEGLGSFLELEVVLSGSQTVAEGEAVAQSLMRELGIPESDLIQGAYVDLIEGNQRVR